MIKKYKCINEAFEEKVKNLESIFSSFRSLHEIYVEIMKTANVNKNSLIAFERLRITAINEQDKISNGLYAQGYILLTGTAEALLKDVFESLLIENFTKIRNASGNNFSIKEIQQVMMDSKDGLDSFDHLSAAFGRIVRSKLSKDNRSATERVNFQNVKTMIDVFKQYFGLEIDVVPMTNSIHRSWQVRHCLVHNNSLIDERFINNVTTVNLLKKSEKVGKYLSISKADYQNVKNDFLDLFTHITSLIEKANLDSIFVTQSF